MIAAIDPGMNHTAITVGDAVDGYEMKIFGETSRGNKVVDRCARYDALVHRIKSYIEPFKSTAIFMEGYSYTSNDAGAKYSAEFGGILRYYLVDLTPDIYEVAPGTLKKFATGSGKGKKVPVIAHITKRYGVVFDTDDEYDSFALFQLGLVACQLEPAATQAQQEAAETVLGRKFTRLDQKKTNNRPTESMSAELARTEKEQLF